MDLNNLKKLNNIKKIGGTFRKNNMIMSVLRNNNTNFLPLHNNGSVDQYSNSCMWLSILQYLNLVLGNQITINEIRNIGRVYDNNQMFDAKIENHWNGILEIARVFDLEIFIIPINIHNPNYLTQNNGFKESIGNGRHKVNIVAYGMHFELILYSEDHRINLLDYIVDDKKEKYINEIKEDKKVLIYNPDINDYEDINNITEKIKIFENDKKIVYDSIKNIELLLKDVDATVYKNNLENELKLYKSNILLLSSEINVLKAKKEKLNKLLIKQTNELFNKNNKNNKNSNGVRKLLENNIEEIRKNIRIIKNLGGDTTILENQMNQIRKQIENFDLQTNKN